MDVDGLLPHGQLCWSHYRWRVRLQDWLHSGDEFSIASKVNCILKDLLPVTVTSRYCCFHSSRASVLLLLLYHCTTVEKIVLYSNENITGFNLNSTSFLKEHVSVTVHNGLEHYAISVPRATAVKSVKVSVLPDL